MKTSNNNRTLLHEAVIHGRAKFVRILRRRFNAGKYVRIAIETGKSSDVLVENFNYHCHLFAVYFCKTRAVF